MKFKAGFIGTGNMGGALARAVGRTGFSVALCDTDEKKTAALAQELKSAQVCSFDDAVKNSHFLFLAVKPNIILSLSEKLRGILPENAVIVTVAAGVTIKEIAEASGCERVIRIMPNTPVEVGEGMVLFCPSNAVSYDEITDFCKIMECAGKLDLLPEPLFDAAAALSGCGPAYAYMFAEALADGAVACGLPRDKAAQYAAQMLKGSAEMLLCSDKHPEKLKDEVCSPGGTTIEGVRALEDGGFRAAAANAVTAAYEKTARLKK